MNETYEQLKQTANRWMNEIWQNRDLSNFYEIHHASFIDCSPAGRENTREDYYNGIVALFDAFPDFTTKTEDLIIDVLSRKVAIRWSATGTHRKTFLEIPQIGKTIYFQGIEIITINQNGELVERWGEWDGLSIQKQLLTEIIRTNHD